jgi:hypothetical protein
LSAEFELDCVGVKFDACFDCDFICDELYAWLDFDWARDFPILLLIGCFLLSFVHWFSFPNLAIDSCRRHGDLFISF